MVKLGNIASRPLATAAYMATAMLLTGAWDMSNPTEGQEFNTTASVSGIGTAPEQTTAFIFRIQEDNLGPVLNETNGTSVMGTWGATVEPPSGGNWPVGEATAVLRVGDENVDFVDIKFVE